MGIDQLLLNKKISLRVFNLCALNQLNTVSDLKKYYRKHKTFINLPRCGLKGDYVLKKICESEKDQPIEKKVNFKKIYNNLSPDQISIIDGYIEMRTANLNARCKNSVNYYLDKNCTLDNFIKKILHNPNYHISIIDGIGPKFEPTVEDYIGEIKNFILQIAEKKDEKETHDLLYASIIYRTYGIRNIPPELIESDNIFRWADFLLSQNAFFDDRTIAIFNKTLNIYEGQNTDFEGLADGLNLTEERIRQIRDRGFERLPRKLEFLQIFKDKLYEKYRIDPEKSFIFISDKLSRQINQMSHTRFTRGFITLILYSYLKNKFALVGNMEYSLVRNKRAGRDKHKWKNIYLLREDIAKNFNFTKLVEDVHVRRTDKLRRTYYLDIKKYLSEFLINKNRKALDKAPEFLKTLLKNEFGISINSKNIIFEKNTKRTVYDCAFEALEHLGKPSHLTLIYKKIKELYPNHKITLSSMRASMKQKFGFVPIGRSSTFGLKKWEQELDNFKGGTIRSITKELLEKSEMPKHISEIVDHVLLFRPTSNSSNISLNLRLDKSGTFVFFKNSYIGLKYKKYNKIKLKKLEVAKAERINKMLKPSNNRTK